MGKKVRLTESQINSIIALRLNEYGVKGRWKPEWDEMDQTLAMYNSLYGIEELGISKKELAEKIIGTSLASFNQQTSNFDYLNTGQGLDRPHPLQNEIYDKYQHIPREEFRKICQEIINKRLETPPEAVVNRKKELKKRGVDKDRMDALRKQGIQDPERFKLLSSKAAEVPDDEEDIRPSESSSKEEIKSFLNDLIGKLTNAETKEEIQQLAGDVEFIRDYIDDEWSEGENLVAEARSIYYNKTIPELTRIKQVMGI